MDFAAGSGQHRQALFGFDYAPWFLMVAISAGIFPDARNFDAVNLLPTRLTL